MILSECGAYPAWAMAMTRAASGGDWGTGCIAKSWHVFAELEGVMVAIELSMGAALNFMLQLQTYI
jgi:hypothetical protein